MSSSYDPIVLCGVRRQLLVFAATVMVVGVALVANAAAGTSTVNITSATVNADRTVSVTWNTPAASYGGAFIANPTSTTDFTGALPFDVGTTIDYNLLAEGWTTYKTLPLNMTIQQPTTIYVQVQLIDPLGDGGCNQGDFLADCDSQVVALTVNPICAQVEVTEGYYSQQLVTAARYTKKLIHRGHWLRRHGHYVKRHGHRVWVKPVYKRIYHGPVYKQVWNPPVYQQQCH